MTPLAHALPGRTHGVVRVPVVAGSVAVAVERVVVGFANGDRYRAVAGAPGRDPVDPQETTLSRGRDLARVELVVGVEGSLDLLQALIEWTEEGWSVFRAYALAMLAP